MLAFIKLDGILFINSQIWLVINHKFSGLNPRSVHTFQCPSTRHNSELFPVWVYVG